MTAEKKRKREAWCIALQKYNFDNVIFTDESRFQFYTDVKGGQNLDIVKKWCRSSHQLLRCEVE